jgi:hypothetical protein
MRFYFRKNAGAPNDGRGSREAPGRPERPQFKWSSAAGVYLNRNEASYDVPYGTKPVEALLLAGNNPLN